MATQKGSPRFKPRGGQRPLAKGPASSLWYGLAFLLLLVLAQIYWVTPGDRTIPYSEFKTLLKNGEIVDVTVGEQAIHGTLKNPPAGDPKQPKEFTTTRVDDAKLTEDLDVAHVQYKGELVNRWLPDLLGWIVPLVLLVGIWGFFFRRMG